MSHITDFMEEVAAAAATPGPRLDTTANVMHYFTTASKSARVYRTQKKVQNRRVSYAADLVAYNEELEHPETLLKVVKSNWKVYHVSPLWNVQMKARRSGRKAGSAAATLNESQFSLVERQEYDPAAMRRYARVLQGFLMKHQYDSTDISCQVEMAQLQGLRGSRNDADAIEISVEEVLGSSRRTVFQGILAGIDTAELEVTSTLATSLPVLLTSGSLDITDRVIYGLQKCFDCVIGPLLLSPGELQWISSMWAGLATDPDNQVEEDVGGENDNPEASSVAECTVSQQPSTSTARTVGRKRPRTVLGETSAVSRDDIINSQQRTVANDGQSAAKKQLVGQRRRRLPSAEVLFKYRPAESSRERVRGKLASIRLRVADSSVQQLWRSVHKSGESEFTEEEMEKFHKSLFLHVKSTMGLNLSLLDLEEVRLPLVWASRQGRIRVLHTSHVKMVLRYLTELCQGNMLSANPNLGITSEML